MREHSATVPGAAGGKWNHALYQSLPFPPRPSGEHHTLSERRIAKDSELGRILSSYVDPFWLVRGGARKKLVEREGLEVQ